MVVEILLGLGLIGGTLVLGLRQVRPVELGVVERFGKFQSIANPGLRFLIPFADKMAKVNITEQMVDIEPQYVITKDNLNAKVDAVVYYKISNVKDAMYNVDNHRRQLTSLARTTLRAVIGKMTLTQANEDRDKINVSVEAVLNKETKTYGVEVLRVEIQKVEPPEDVQEEMNEVVKAERKKIAAVNLATAKETEADGERRSIIKKAQGDKQARIEIAQGKAKAIELENVAADKYFIKNAQTLKKLEVTQA